MSGLPPLPLGEYLKQSAHAGNRTTQQTVKVMISNRTQCWYFKRTFIQTGFNNIGNTYTYKISNCSAGKENMNTERHTYILTGT